MGISLPQQQRKSAFQYASIIVALVLVGQLPEINTGVHAVASRAMENIAGVVGMAVAVPQNGENRLAQELQRKEIQLNEREKAIDAKEQDFRAIVIEENNKQDRVLILTISSITLFFILLIGLNFYLDRKRGTAPLKSDDGGVKTGPHAHEGEFTTKL
jgi:hypothetical protein